MDNFNISSYDKKYYSRKKEKHRLLFQHAIKHGLNSLTISQNNKEKIELIEYFKRRVEYPYVHGKITREVLPGLYILSYDEISLVNNFKSIGISDEKIINKIKPILQKTSSKIMFIEYECKKNMKKGSDSNIKKDLNYSKKSKYLKNKDIRDQFIKTFMVAEEEINIISPWMNENVIDENLIKLMSEALDRGVKIKIIYGIGNQIDKRSKNSDNVAVKLRERFAHYGSRFIVERSHTHVKMLICDSKYMMVGSFNFLSFKGDYTKDLRDELVKYDTNKDRIKEQRIINFRKEGSY